MKLEPVATVAETHMSRYTLEWTNGPLPEGTALYAIPYGFAVVPVEQVKDAERYAWLRDVSVPPHNFYLSVPVEFDGVRYKPHEVDSYIDQAMLAAKGE